ncbi:hypothetical protein [Halobacteriovorax sp. HLS]|uniref:hypothetical protein n=1 Tax=Halobacteriovorax sp. HLS TaxID=2234000 RepID=UPI000FD8A400|nr:hypothetical protein [Halobacteriovorax sp. HLS]
MKLNDKGFSLVQILITSGMLGAAAVVGINMMNNQQKVAESTNQKYEIAYIYEEIWKVLQNPLTCQTTFKDKSIDQWNQDGINSIAVPYKDGKFYRSLNIYKTYDTGFNFYGIGNLKIAKYELIEATSVLEPMMNLVITFDRGKNTIGAQEIKKIVPISFINFEGKIESCNAVAIKDIDDENEDQQELPLENVSLDSPAIIGRDTTPASSLDIYGNISITTPILEECTQEQASQIRFNEINSTYEFCTGTPPWRVWGKDKISWNNYTKRVVNTGQEQIIGEFKYCALTEIQNAKVDACAIKNTPSNFEEPSQWVLAKSMNSSGSCVFSCYE